jgi:2-succinyl-5-enolpyruvyl-6-hydroxy-3-cyclohexene-1-carboxylate synthase
VTNVQATFAATLVDEWVRCGVQHAVVSPGSRSTPLALALAADDRVRLQVHHDERAASFMALGVGKVSGTPAVLLTTSGTAAAELHAAVVEAHQARVPMLVCTADRPPELQSVGAPQTIDQTHLFGRAVRWFVEPGVADDTTSSTWRSLAARAFVEATGAAAGPVHLNLAFRDPLVGEPGELPPGRRDGRPWHQRGPVVLAHPERISGRRGLIVAGAGCSHLGSLDVWPVLADPLSGVPGVRAFDALLRTGRMPEPDVVLRVGDAPASKVLAQWLASLDCPQHVVASSWSDPDRVASTYSHTYSMVDSERDDEWWALWHDADAAAQRAIDEVLASKDVVTEPFVARTVSQVASTLVVSSSMPIRDVEWFGAPGAGRRILANRGANGIDGVVSTGVGVAIGSGDAVTILVGDIAFLHDANALLGLGSRGVDVTVVVIDNRGGGIFSFLPQAAALAPERFELLFGTPHDVDLEAFVAAHGLPVTTVTAPSALRGALEGPGPKVVVVPTDRVANVAVHDELHAAVAAAVGR